MQKIKFILFAVVFLGGFSGMGHAQTVTENYGEAIVFVGDQEFQTELAQTIDEQRMGLMFRRSIEPDQAMLFINKSIKRVYFWMKNTKINLDILYFDKKGRLLEIKSNVVPCVQEKCPVYPSKSDQVAMVLEIKGGEAERRQIKVGDLLKGCGF